MNKLIPTQGKWKVASHKPFDEYATIITTQGRFSGDFSTIIARAEVSVYISTEQAEANALLIAAAPELLEALELIATKLYCINDTVTEDIRKIALDAISKVNK